MDANALIIAGIAIPALIIGIVQMAKRFFPNASGNVWLGVSILLALVFWVLAAWANNGRPASLKEWLALVVLALNFALSAAGAYDRTIGGKA